MPAPTRPLIDRSTLIGMSAILMWSSTIGLYRAISEIYGPIGGAALMFSVSGLFATLLSGRRSFSGHSLRYLLLGGALFVAYEISLALAVGMASSRLQSLEVGLLNYLWPSFTIALAVMVGQARADIFLMPGILLCLGGVVLASVGGSDFTLAGLIANWLASPLPYLLGLVAAITWPAYTILTRVMARGLNAVPIFLLATAAALWVAYALSDEPALEFSLKGALLIAGLGALTTGGYTAWTYGVNHGNLTLMATASYFTPLFSVLLGSLMLGMVLHPTFWMGAGLVTAGSLLCWYATRPR